MFYWLFTDGRALLGGCLAPLLCLTLLAPILVSAMMGAGIQRTSSPQQAMGWKRGAKLFAHLIVLLGVSAIYLALLGDMAVQIARGRQPANGVIQLLAGAPQRLRTQSRQSMSPAVHGEAHEATRP